MLCRIARHELRGIAVAQTPDQTKTTTPTAGKPRDAQSVTAKKTLQDHLKSAKDANAIVATATTGKVPKHPMP